MPIRSTTERLKALQTFLGLEPDGAIGPQTLDAIEKALPGFQPPEAKDVPPTGMRLSDRGIAAIVRFEVSSDNYYNRHLKQPHWPGGDSGITIGIGYDLGYQTEERFLQDWGEVLPDAVCDRLAAVCGKKAKAAKSQLASLEDISISLAKARLVFSKTSLPLYAKKTQRAYPGVDNLYPDAQTALVSLVYNRGTGMRGDSRREMRELKEHVKKADYQAIAAAIVSMKRIWEGRNLGGLLKRRDDEAALVLGAERDYIEDEVITV